MEEKWIHWSPIENRGEHYNIERCYQNRYGLFLLLWNRPGYEKNMQIIFKSPIGGYRFTQESHRLKLLNEWSKQGATGTAFLRVENSNYIEFLMLVPGNNVSKNQLTHYVVSDDNYIIDIAAFEDPIVTIVD